MYKPPTEPYSLEGALSVGHCEKPPHWGLQRPARVQVTNRVARLASGEEGRTAWRREAQRDCPRCRTACWDACLGLQHNRGDISHREGSGCQILSRSRKRRTSIWT